jgi:hypothetical protein
MQPNLPTSFVNSEFSDKPYQHYMVIIASPSILPQYSSRQVCGKYRSLGISPANSLLIYTHFIASTVHVV